MSALVKAQPSILDLLVTAEWPLAVIEVVRKSKVPRGCSDEEFYLFMRQAQVSGMNPILNQCYCVPRRTNVGTRDNPNWVTSHVFQVAIDGMRSRAGRHKDFMSSNACAVWEGDTIEIDSGTGHVSHKMNPAKRGARIVGAWGRVEKKGATPVVVWLPVGSRSGTGDFWTKDPGSMLALGAERVALRRAYPTEFDGVPGFDEVEEHEPTRDAVVEAVATVLPAAPPSPEGPLCAFAPHKGREIASMAPEELRAAISTAEENLAKPEAEKWAPKVRAKVEKALADLRAALPSVPALPEPGLVTDFEVLRQPEPLRTPMFEQVDKAREMVLERVVEGDSMDVEPTQEQIDAERKERTAKERRT